MFSPTSASHNRSTDRLRDAVAALSITQRQALYLTRTRLYEVVAA